MRLRTKFSLLLTFCVLGSVFLNTMTLTRSFVQDQQSYLHDFQSSVALFSEGQLHTRMDLLHSQFEEISAVPAEFRNVVSRIPGCRSGQLWRVNRLVASFPERITAAVLPPAKGDAPWTLLPTTQADPERYVQWIGRFARGTVVLELQEEYFDRVLDNTHGSVSQLLTADGTTVLPIGMTGAKEVLPQAAVFGRVSQGQPGMPRTLRYTAVSGPSYLGTVLPLADNPDLLILVTTPNASVQAEVSRTFWRSAATGLLCLVLAVVMGTLFSNTFTSPLRVLVGKTEQISKGNFEAPPVEEGGRGDEVGLLARSFNKMIGELKKIRDELRRAERLAAIGRLSAAMAHEIKNPLFSILGNTQVAKKILGNTPGMETARDALGFVEEESLRANRLVNQLMKCARHDKPTTVIDLTERVQRSSSILAPTAEQARVTLKAVTPDRPIWCLANGDQLHEVLANLVQNAIYAVKGRPSRDVVVELLEEGGVARLCVRDTGSGVSPEAKEHLFEAFFTTKPLGEGTGLGLAVCHGIIENHAGRIEVTSELEKGTEFTIVLPTCEAPLRAAA